MDNKYIRKKRIVWAVVILLLLLYIATIIYHQVKELPEGVPYAGEEHWMDENEISFLYDLTYQTEDGEVYEHEIFESILQMIEEAESFLIVDMFMLNDFSDEAREFPEMSTIFKEKIKEQIKTHPDLEVVIITDVINRSYNSHEALHIDELADYGAEIIYADLTKLRDPNPLYSGIWRMFFQWFGQEGPGWLPNPFGEASPNVTFRSYLKLANIKANHRKAIITENEGLVTSANIHDASAFHSNVAVKVTGPILKDMVESERVVAAFSGGDLDAFSHETELNSLSPPDSDTQNAEIRAQIVTEKNVETSFLQVAEQAGPDDEIWVGMFYLSDRTIIGALHDAAIRGVKVRLILDPNENAFGSQKIGLPNVPIARELMEETNGDIDIRWYLTNEEQYHSKIAYVKREEESYVTLGSTNFTSRNLDNYNLENNIVVRGANDSTFMQDIKAYFHRIWHNEDAVFTVPYDVEVDMLNPLRYGLYWVQKLLRFTTY